MKRRSFLKGSAVAGVTTLCGAGVAHAARNGMPKLKAPEKTAQLKNLVSGLDLVFGGALSPA